MGKHIERLPDHRRAHVQTYIAGFALSFSLSAAAFSLVWAYRAADTQIMSRGLLLGLLAVLAVAQILVQALFFLHMSAERRARLTLYSSIFTVTVVIAIVGGSIWIMQNLNYNMIPKNPDTYIQQEENIHPH